MSAQGVMTRKKASYNPGFNPIKGQKFCPGTQTGSRDKLSSLSLGVTNTCNIVNCNDKGTVVSFWLLVC